MNSHLYIYIKQRQEHEKAQDKKQAEEHENDYESDATDSSIEEPIK